MPTKTAAPKFSAAKLIAAREQANLTRTQLAEAAGISRQMLRVFEMGDNVPGLNTAFKLAHALNISVEQLAD